MKNTTKHSIIFKNRKEKNMKKFIRILMVAVLFFALVACGKSSGLSKTVYKLETEGAMKVVQTFEHKDDEVHKFVYELYSKIGEGKMFATKDDAEYMYKSLVSGLEGKKGFTHSKDIKDTEATLNFIVDFNELDEEGYNIIAKEIKKSGNSKYPSLKELEKKATEIGLTKQQ